MSKVRPLPFSDVPFWQKLSDSLFPSAPPMPDCGQTDAPQIDSVQISNRPTSCGKTEYLQMVRQDGMTLQRVPLPYRVDRDVVLAAVKQNGLALQYAHRTYRGNAEIALIAATNNPAAMQYLDQEILEGSFDFFKGIVLGHRELIWYLGPNLLKDWIKNAPEWVASLIFPTDAYWQFHMRSNRYVSFLKYINPQLMNDRQFTLEAIKINVYAAEYVPDSLKRDRSWALEAVKISGLVLKFLPEAFQGDEEIVLAVIHRHNSNRWDRDDIADSLKANRQFSLKAIEANHRFAAVVADSLKNDKSWALEAVGTWGEVLQYLPEEFKNDREIVTRAVLSTPLAYRFIGDKLIRADKPLALEGVKRDGDFFKSLPETFRADREIVNVAIGESSYAAHYVADSLKNDRGWALEAVKISGLVLEDLPETFRADREIVNAAIGKYNCHVVKYVADSLKNDRNWALEAVKINGLVLEWLPETMRADREIVNAAIGDNFYAAEHVADSLKHDRSWVLEAVKINGLVLKYMPDELKDDIDVVRLAVAQYSMALEFAGPKPKSDLKTVLIALEQHDGALKFLGPLTCKNRTEALDAVKKFPGIFQNLPENFRQDREIALSAVSQDGLQLQYAGTILSRDRKMVLAAVKQNGLALEFADVSFRKNPEIVLEATKNNGGAFKFANPKFGSNRLYVAMAVASNGEALQYADAKFKSDQGLVLTSVKTYPKAILCVEPQLLENRDFVLRAVRENGLVLEHLPEHFKADEQVVSAAARQNIDSLKYANPSLLAKNDFKEKLIKLDGKALCYFSSDDKKQASMAQAAMHTNPDAAECVDQSLYADRDIAIQLVSTRPYLYKELPESTKVNFDVVMAAVKTFGGILEVVPSEFRENMDVAMAAVHSDPSALRFTPNLRGDSSLLQSALTSERWPENEKFAEEYEPPAYYGYGDKDVCSPLLAGIPKDRDPKQLAIHAVHQGGIVLKYLSADLKRDFDVVMAAVQANGLALKYADERFRKNRKIVMAAVRQNGVALEYAHPSLKADKMIVRAAIANNPHAIWATSLPCQEAQGYVRDFLAANQRALKVYGISPESDPKEALSKMHYSYNPDPEITSLTSSASWKEDKNMAKRVCKIDGSYLENVNDKLKDNFDVVLAAVRENGLALRHASNRLKANPQIQQAAFAQNLNATKFMFDISPSVRMEYEQIRDELRELGITSLERLPSTEFAREVVKNRKNSDKPDKRPTIFVTMTHSDGNGGFNGSDYPYSKDKYRIMYYEVKDKSDILTAVKDSSRFGRVKGGIIAGHGERRAITLSSPADAVPQRIISDDVEFAKALGERIENDGFLILDSCSNGQGASLGANLANMFHEQIPNVHIYSFTEPFSKSNVQVERELWERYASIGRYFQVYDGRSRSILYAISPTVRRK